MRNFAIAQLESRFQSPSILRIKLSDELNITTWAKPAFIELCQRAEPITQDEAKVLGAERLAEVSRIREAEQRRKLIQLVDKSVGSHRLLDGAKSDDKLRDDAKCTLRYSSLPKCDCRVQTVCDDTQLDSRSINPNTLPPKGLKDSGYSVVPCQIHKIAPRVVSESLALFEQRNDLVKRLEELKMVVSNTASQGGGKESSVEDEINRATWLRKFT
ncbi:unnamed protein product [Rhizoctonia solani]|uniref:Uncharacterized protein n=1 Tax=Rhizoctonia solani TaxID=456999 RepID=A0A8H2WJU1_9AGAM|nr:unnamed protein product [Rhizoctonia solani]